MKIEKIQKLKERFDQHAQWWDDMHTVEIWKARDLMELLVSDILGDAEMERLGLRAIQRLPWITPQHIPYLQWHREQVFKGKENI